MPTAVSSDCENRKWLSSVKKPRKKMTKASRWALSSSVLSASSSKISALPASRPKMVRNCEAVMPMASTSKPMRTQRVGRGFCRIVSHARHASKPRQKPLISPGMCGICISTTQPTTASRNRVSRLSRVGCQALNQRFPARLWADAGAAWADDARDEDAGCFMAFSLRGRRPVLPSPIRPALAGSAGRGLRLRPAPVW